MTVQSMTRFWDEAQRLQTQLLTFGPNSRRSAATLDPNFLLWQQLMNKGQNCSPWPNGYKGWYWICWLMKTWVLSLVLELSWELEVVVAAEGEHHVGRGPPSCQVCATAYPCQTPPRWLDSRDLAKDALWHWIHLEKKQSLSTFDCSNLYICSL